MVTEALCPARFRTGAEVAVAVVAGETSEETVSSTEAGLVEAGSSPERSWALSATAAVDEDMVVAGWVVLSVRKCGGKSS